MSTPTYQYPQSLVPELYDAITDCTYNAGGNMLTVSFRVGGLSGVVVGTLTMTYDASGNILTCVRS